MSKSSFGHGVGLAFKESNLVLNTKNQETVKYASPLCWHAPTASSHPCLPFTTPRAGMTFVVTVSLHGVPLTDRRSSSSSVVSKLEKFDILLVDTVVANAKASDILTSKAHRELADVSWEIGDGEEEDEDEDEDEAKAEPEEPAAGRSVRPVCGCGCGCACVCACVCVRYLSSGCYFPCSFASLAPCPQRYRSRRLQELEAKAGGPTAMEEAQQRAEKQVRLRLRQKELALEALKKRDASDGEDEHDERADQPIIAYTAYVAWPSAPKCRAEDCALANASSMLPARRNTLSKATPTTCVWTERTRLCWCRSLAWWCPSTSRASSLCPPPPSALARSCASTSTTSVRTLLRQSTSVPALTVVVLLPRRGCVWP